MDSFGAEMIGQVITVEERTSFLSGRFLQDIDICS
jgi:hypothetical protein